MDRTGELAAGLRTLLAAGIISIGEAAAFLEKADDMKKQKRRVLDDLLPGRPGETEAY